ncbi:MAG: putative methyltransferase [Bacteroidetes bacterium]|nr:putative methyltransferase [Bacteroidota bacterium]
MEINKKVYSNSEVVKHYADYSSTLQRPEKTITELLQPKLKEMRMLDIGVGAGRTTVFFADKVKEYTGIDFSDGMIEACKEKLGKAYPAAGFETMDVRDLSHYADNSFDFVLFSFNGLDNISHEERIVALSEIRRICAEKGTFCFSSHNLQCLPVFFSIRFRWHPVRFLKSLFARKRLIARNKEQIGKFPEADHVTIFDDVYDFGLHTYYIRPSAQIEQLRKNGFSNVKVFSFDTGEELPEQQYDSATDSWLYYLCSKN